jgi:phosphatidylglycerophosphatase A
LTTFAEIAERPSWRFVATHPAHFIAFGFGAGLARIAPGTVGTLVALPIYWILKPVLPAPQFLLLLCVLFAIGAWACEVTGKALGVPDHGGMVWDEIVAFLLVLVFTPATLSWQAFAYVCFRFFDIAKPPPVRQVDARVKGGLGVMLDDLFAAIYALLVIAVVKRIVA